MSGMLQHSRDVNNKEIFRNNVLASQFLRDYSGSSIFSNVQPEDLEDQSERFRLMLGIEVTGDTIKKVRVRIEGQEKDIYIITLLEHKSYVDYDVAMQLLRYMTAIWYDYSNEQKKDGKEASKRKDFRYPLIFPIVYYEGSTQWTANVHLSDRIEFAELADGYIPDFTYHVVALRDYMYDDFVKHDNEISLLMMINRIQGADDFSDFRKKAEEFTTHIFYRTTPDIQDIIINVIWSLLLKIKIPTEEITDILTNFKEGKDMGYLFENFKEFDAIAEREAAREEKEAAREEKEAARAEKEAARAERKEAERAKKEAERAKEKAEKDKEKAEKDKKVANAQLKTIKLNLLTACKADHLSKEDTAEKLMTICLMNSEETSCFLNDHWESL